MIVAQKLHPRYFWGLISYLPYVEHAKQISCECVALQLWFSPAKVCFIIIVN